MGGCRCIFRGCENNTTSRPGMHFFHFPIKDADRCEKWIMFSNNPSFREMEDKKLKNRNVCEEHFRIKMFMNIRKERLVRFAYPTLLKTKHSSKVYDLEKMKESHDIDDFNVDTIFHKDFDKYQVEEAEDPTINRHIPSSAVMEEGQIEFTLNEQNIADMPIDFKDEKDPLTNEISVTNQIILTPVKTKKVLNQPVKRPIEEAKEVILTPVPTKKMKTIKILNSPNLMKTVNNPVEQSVKLIKTPSTLSSTVNRVTLKTAITPEKNVKQEREYLEKIEKLTIERNEAIVKELSTSRQLTEAEGQISMLEAKVQELEEKLKEAEASKGLPVGKKPKISINIGSQTDPESKIVVKSSPSPQIPVKPGSLSKPQLFNGIKRYLSNAMSTLLKMEMFGSNEREWKADEKKISCEIMGLGKEVYEYFTDEWRLRLPSKTEVSSWLQDNADDDDEDLY